MSYFKKRHFNTWIGVRFWLIWLFVSLLKQSNHYKLNNGWCWRKKAAKVEQVSFVFVYFQYTIYSCSGLKCSKFVHSDFWQIDWKTVKIYGLFWCLKRSCQNERISNISTETFTIFILSIEYFDLVIQLKSPIESNWTYTQYTHTRYSECERPKKSMHRSINHMVQFSF